MPALERSRGPERADGSAAGASEECRDDVGGVPVERDSRPVVTHGGAGVGVAGGLLHVAERHAGVEGSGDERVTQSMGAHSLGDPRPAGDTAHDPAGRVAIDPLPVGSHEDRPVAAFADRQIDGPSPSVRGASGMVTTLPPLRRMVSVRWPRSSPRSSMSAPMASETHSPLRASRLIKA